MKQTLTLLALLASATAVPAAFIHVSPSGSDTNNGSLANPFQTIAKALSIAQPGDSVELHAGTYRETVSPPRSGTALNPITIENYSNETVVVSACNVVAGPWTAGTNGIYTATAPGSLPVTFWGSAPNTGNGSFYTETAGHLVGTVVNEGTSTTLTMTSANASSAWNFFANAVTWQVGGLSIITNSGAVPMPPANAGVWFSIKSPLTTPANGFSADDGAIVTFNGTGRMALNLKKNAPNSMGTQVYTITDPNINGYALTLGPASGANVPYQFIVKRSTGVNTTNSGNWAILQSDWSDGGTGTSSFVDIFAQQNTTPTPNLNQQFSFTVGSYTITSGTNTILSTDFWDGIALVDYFSGATNSPVSTGCNQVFVDGVMQQEARYPNYGPGDVLHPATAAVTINRATDTPPSTITATNFGGQPTGFFVNGRFFGAAGSAWCWQNAVVTNSSGNSLTVDKTTESTWWWPDYEGTWVTKTGVGYVYGLLNLLDADGEWYFAPSNSLLSLRITGAADPTGHLVEVKRRNWCVNVNGVNYITVHGLQTLGGAIQLNGNGNVLDGCNAGYLSHFLAFKYGYSPDGGVPQGGGVILNGSGCTVMNCTLHDTAGTGIYSQGSGHLITRNTLYNLDYAGLFTAGLRLDGDGEVATFNTIYNCGRDVVEPNGTGETILFNNFSGSGFLCKDLGVIYLGWNNSISTNGNGTRIAYNWIHDGAPTDSHNSGIYLDNFARNYQADHNVIWNFSSTGVGAVTNGIHMNSPGDGHELYHNTLFNCGTYNIRTYNAYSTNSTGNSGGSTYWQPTNQHLLYVAQNNLVLSNNVARLENVTNYDFRLVAGDPAINPTLTIGTNTWITTNGIKNVPAGFGYNATTMNQTFTYSETNGQGVAVPGVNGWVPSGNPDSGAYERGVAPWSAGVTGWDGLTNDPPSAITTNSATLQGVRIAVNQTSTQMRLYYGTTDGGTNAGAWAITNDLGTAAPTDVISVFRPALSNLTAGTTYYARFQTSNTNGIAWSAAQSFTTLVPTTYDLWTGAVNGSWDTTNLNWSNGGPTAYSDGSAVQFDDTATGSTLVTNAVTVSPGGVLVTNNTQNYVISGSSIAGSGSLTKSGTGTLRLKSVNTFAGSLTVSRGVLITGSDTASPLTGVLGNPNTAGRQITVASGATLTFGNHDTFGNWTATPAVMLNISGTVNNSAAVVNALGAVNFNGGTLAASSGYSGGSGIAYALNSLSNVTVSGSSPSTISLTGGSYIGLNGVVTFNVASGALLNVAGPLKNHPAPVTGGLTMNGAGTLILTATNSYTGLTTVSAGTLLVNGATGTNTVTVTAGATLGGSGVIGGKVTLSAGAFATNGVGSPLTVTNGLTLNGNTMNVSTLSALGAGDYLLITNTSATPISGSFAAVNVSGAGVAGTASIVTTAKAVTLHVAPSAPPVFSGISVSGTSLTLNVTNGAPNGAWTLLQSTNLTTPLSQWTTNATGNYDASGKLSTNFLNTVTNPMEFYILK